MKRVISITLLITVISLLFLIVSCNNNKSLTYFQFREIKKSYINCFEIRDKSVDDVILDYYAGEYNGCKVVMLDTECRNPTNWIENVGDRSITYYDSNRLLVFKDKSFITLSDAYSLGLLSEFQIDKIITEYNNNVTQFADICDIYDFNKQPKHTSIFKLLTKFDYKSIHFNELTVVVDPKLSMEGMHLSKKFFGNFALYEITCLGVNSVMGYPDSCGYRIHLKNSGILNTAYIISKIERIPGVLLVTPMIYSGYQAVPSDPSYISDAQWGLKDIQIEKVWDFTTGSKEITVGIVDSGISNHPDLNGNLISGWDYYNDSEYENDDVLGHGTHIAGIIGAVGNNASGISGVNWKVQLISLQNINAIDNAQYSAIYNYRPNLHAAVEAIKRANSSYTTNNPIRVLNMSFILENGSEELKNAIDTYNGLIVCSAGNSGDNLDNCIAYPQHYDSSNIIVVGAIDEDRERSIWNNGQSSNYGETTVDIYAPGSNIYSTSLSNTYQSLNGTSQAAPYVSGVAALLWSVDPELTNSQIKDCILNGAEKTEIIVVPGILGIGKKTETVKRLDAWGAFKYLMNNYYTPTSYQIGYWDAQLTDYIEADGEYFDAHTSMIKLNILVTGSYTFNISSDYGIKTTLYNSNFDEIPTSQIQSNENREVEFTYTLNAGTYYLKTKYLNNTSAGDISITIDCPPHTHSYTEWKYFSPTMHKEKCACGAVGTKTNPHVLKKSEMIEGMYDCVLCGHRIPYEDGGFGQIIMNIQKVTLNGSYILPNGIIVLVDEDIEAYFNGTLVFYDKDDLPQIQ